MAHEMAHEIAHARWLEEVDMALSISFVVTLDDTDLGAFYTCEGLGCEVVVESREEGGNNGFVHQFPTRLKYPNIKFTRPLGRDTVKVTRLFSSMVSGYRRSTATIVVRRGDNTPLVRWSLTGVLPIRWTGPSLNPDQSKVLTETLEIAHQGFEPLPTSL